MRTTLTLLFVLILCTCPGSDVDAQIDNFQPATIVLDDGAELTGWISLENNAKLATRVRFRPGKTDRNGEQRYSPRQLQKLTFSDDGKVYKRIPYRFTMVGDSVVRNEFRMAELLYKGACDLLTLDRGPGEYFTKGKVIYPRAYFLDDGENTAILEVIQRAADLRFSEGKSNIRFNLIEDYRGKLKYFFRDWPKANAEAEKMRYTTEDMIRIFDAYTKFKDPAATDTQIGKIRPATGVTARVYYASETRFLTEDEGADQSAFGGGLYFDRPLLGANGTVSIETGVEVFVMSFGLGSQRNNREQFERGYALRVPAYGNLYLSKQGLFQPRLRFGGSLSMLAFTGEEIVGLGTRQKFSRLVLDVSLHGGVGADVGRFTVDAGFDIQMGPLFSVGYRFK